jgi:glycosyltransferase involved in cell wall biosynthesis
MLGSVPRTPIISVLVPCYNKAVYLEPTLQSVYAQSLQNWELIVVDDGSSDASADILRRHQAQGSLVAIFQANQGASAARQRALSEARGRYIQYLDADDQLLPSALADRVLAIERTGADVAYSDWQRLRGGTSSGFERAEVVARRIEDVDADPELACFGSFWSPPAALLYTRDIVDRIGPWNTTLPVIQDARYLLDAALAGARFVHVPGVSALYRDDLNDSLSRRSNRAFAADVARNADQVHAIWKARGRLGSKHRAALLDCYDYAARVAFRDDGPLFQHCVERMAELGGQRLTRWPMIAARLQRHLGRRLALAVLAGLRRPAP